MQWIIDYYLMLHQDISNKINVRTKHQMTWDECQITGLIPVLCKFQMAINNNNKNIKHLGCTIKIWRYIQTFFLHFVTRTLNSCMLTLKDAKFFSEFCQFFIYNRPCPDVPLQNNNYSRNFNAIYKINHWMVCSCLGKNFVRTWISSNYANSQRCATKHFFRNAAHANVIMK